MDVHEPRHHHEGTAVDLHYLLRIPDVGLQLEFVQQGLNDPIAARLEIEDSNSVSCHQRHVGRGPRCFQGRIEVGGQNHDPAIGGKLPPDEDVVEIGVRLEVVDRADQLGQSHSVVISKGTRCVHVPLQNHAGIECRTQP